MRVRDLLGSALRNLRRQKLRSALTIFAVVIGATSGTPLIPPQSLGAIVGMGSFAAGLGLALLVIVFVRRRRSRPGDGPGAGSRRP